MTTNNLPESLKMNQELHEQFELHVLNTCVRNDYPSTYFSTGIAEECVEFLDLVNKILKGTSRTSEQNIDPKIDESIYNLVKSEAGDLLWYLYALSLSLPGGKFSCDKDLSHDVTHKPMPVSCSYRLNKSSSVNSEMLFLGESPDKQKLSDLKDQLCSAMGKLCGSVKKFSRGDQPWKIFQIRIQQEIDILLTHLLGILYLLSKFLNVHEISLEDAMRCNIHKIRERKLKNTIQGDGENR